MSKDMDLTIRDTSANVMPNLITEIFE